MAGEVTTTRGAALMGHTALRRLRTTGPVESLPQSHRAGSHTVSIPIRSPDWGLPASPTTVLCSLLVYHSKGKHLEMGGSL